MTSRLSAERWRVVIPYLDRALELDGSQRDSWLTSLRQEDGLLADDVAALLEKNETLDACGYLDEGPSASPRRASLAGQVLGAYTLREPIGQGGMGSVWLADRTDGRYRGVTAVKLLNASLIGREGEDRFRREGSILARLRHPHIAQLIDAGLSSSGQPYLVLEHVDGQRIDRYCDDRALSVEARLRLFLDVLGAVAHAHANLVVHRDLKPSNVMVGTDGRVKLLDFGIAKLLEPGEATSLTSTGAQLMTPQYAAPEQLTGDDVTTATDVYALGALLYVLLTGRHPTGSETGSPAELIRAIVDTEPLRPSETVVLAHPGQDLPPEVAGRRATTPRKLAGRLHGDLDNVVAKALKKQPGERYASAEAMADDLRRHLDHRPVGARKDSVGYRALKFARRNRLPLGAAVVATCALLGSAAAAVHQRNEMARARDRALLQLRRAEATNAFTGFLLMEAGPSAGKALTSAEVLARGDALVDRRFAGDPALRVHLLLTLAARYSENSQFDRWQATIERAYQASQGLQDADMRARASCSKAQALADEGHASDAERLLAEGLGLLAPSSTDDTAAAETYCRTVESSIAHKGGDPERSIRAAERAVALERDRRGTPGSGFEAQLALATAYLAAERTASADRAYAELMRTLEGEGLEGTGDAAIVLGNWSVALQNAGQSLRALPIAQRAVDVGRARDTDRGASMSSLHGLAATLCAVGRCAEAVPVMEEALEKARASGSPRRLAGVLTSTAGIYREAGQLDRAAATVREAQALFALESVSTREGLQKLDRQRARLALARGEVAEALRLARRARARETDAERASRHTMGLLLLESDVQAAQGDWDAAAASAESALAAARARQGELAHSFAVGQALLAKARALNGRGARDLAPPVLREALEHLRASVGPDARDTRAAEALLAALG